MSKIQFDLCFSCNATYQLCQLPLDGDRHNLRFSGGCPFSLLWTPPGRKKCFYFSTIQTTNGYTTTRTSATTMLRRKFLNSNDIRSSESVTPVVLYWGKKKNQRKNKYDRGDDGRAVCSMTFIDFPSADILFVALKAHTFRVLFTLISKCHWCVTARHRRNNRKTNTRNIWRRS